MLINYHHKKSITYLPYPALNIIWDENSLSFIVKTPWVQIDIDIEENEKEWIKDAIVYLHDDPTRSTVQQFLKSLNDYPLSYYKTRDLDFFQEKNLSEDLLIDIDFSSPSKFINTIGIMFNQDLQDDIPQNWMWDWKSICERARIKDSDLYDPLGFISYLICYRLDWESQTWSGQNGLGHILTKLLETNETRFFQAIGWITKQSWYVTQESCQCLKKALKTFPEAQEEIHHFIKDEAGHYKFMNQVFEDLELDGDNFNVGPATHWLLASHGRMAEISPLAFSSMINLFEAAYYEGDDPISRVIKKSSKPHAARGYDLHYKINQEHRHCDMPLIFGQYLAPQSKEHLYLTLAVFELTLNFLDKMEQKLENYI